MGPKTKKFRKKQILTTKNKNNQSKKIFSLQPYHLKHIQSCLISKAKQGQAWLVLGWETDLQRSLLRDKQFGANGGMPSKFKWNLSCQASQK
jgi:hypothetical protein